MKKQIFLVATILYFSFYFTATSVLAALTLGSTSVASDGVLTLTPTTNTIFSAGYVGIGTISPVSKLNVVNSLIATGDSARALELNSIEWGQLALKDGLSDPSSGVKSFMGMKGSTTTNVLRLDLNRDLSSGVFGNTGMTHAAIQLGVDNADSHVLFYTASANNTHGTERMRIDKNGNVGIGTSSPNAAALVDVSSTTKGFLPPRMTTVQRDAISSPPAGLIIYNTSTNKLNVYTTTWEAITSS